jgi:signal transduction histidine kinase/CheY-like chemotaxis protein
MKAEAVSLLENATWPALVVDGDGTILQVNKIAASTFSDLHPNSSRLSTIWAAENPMTLDQWLANAEKTALPPAYLKLKTGKGTVAFLASIIFLSSEGQKHFLVQLFSSPQTASEGRSASSDSVAAQKQKLDCALQLARSVSLDFNNVLTGILGHTSLILGKLDPNHPWRKSLLEVEKAAARGAEIANDLGSFSRQDNKGPVQAEGNLNPVLQRCVDFFKKTPGSETITWTLQLERKLFAARFDELKMQQAFLRILENSVQALQGSGRITIQSRNVYLDEPTQDRNVRLIPGAYLCAEIADTGCGIEPEVLPRIFEPFFTTKRGTNHRGLGLAWVYGIVTNHGGGVAVSSQPGVGTSVRVYIPAEKRITREHHHTPEAELAGTETVLMVDDEDLIATMAQAILSDHGYKVVTANSGARALELLSRGKPVIDLVITDLIMPGMSGRELVEQIQRLHPGMPIICTSGYVWPGNQARDPNFLQKPFTAQHLLQKIKQVLAHAREPQPTAPVSNGSCT